MRCLVTGATGFLGGHVAEALRGKGVDVRTIARARSDRQLVDGLGVEVIEGDLADDQVVRRACDGIDAVVHCAAKVGDWGPIEEFRKINVAAFETLLQACVGRSLQRFVMVSSLGVYEAKDHHGTTEQAPLPARHIDGYTQTKVEADVLAQKYRREHGLPIVIVRPGFIFGPRDRTVMPRILRNLKRRLVTYFGSREKKINNVYVGNVVEAILLALEVPGIEGEIFNVTDPQCVSKKVFFETIADLAGLPRPVMTYPLWFARGVCASFETAGRTFGFSPVLNMARLKFMGLNLDYSIEHARSVLGYNPSVPFDDGMRRTIDWLREEGRIPASKS